MKRLVCLFPGQGTIDKNVINKDWFSSKISQLIFEEAEKHLSWNVKSYLKNLSYQELSDTKIAQPLIFVLNMAMYYTLFNKSKVRPSVFLGHSLGEFCSLVASEVLTFSQGLEIVTKRGALMAEFYSEQECAMVSVSDVEKNELIKLIEQSKNESHLVDIAAYNSNNQIVLSGFKNAIISVIDQLKDENVKCTFLNVGGPFHSRLYKGIEEKFSQYIKGQDFLEPKGIFISSITGNSISNPEEIRNVLSKQVTSSVLWSNAIDFLNSNYNWLGLEIGSKPVLKGLTNSPNIIEVSRYKTIYEIIDQINNLQEKIFDFSTAAIKVAVTFPNKKQDEIDTIFTAYHEIELLRDSFVKTNELEYDKIENLLEKLLLAKGYDKEEIENVVMKIKKETGMLLNINA